MTTQEILEAARAARSALGLSSGEVRRAALLGMAEALCSPARQQAILEANAADLEAARGHISEVMLDRLALTPERISAMASGKWLTCPTRWAKFCAEWSAPTGWSSKRPPCPWA